MTRHCTTGADRLRPALAHRGVGDAHVGDGGQQLGHAVDRGPVRGDPQPADRGRHLEVAHAVPDRHRVGGVDAAALEVPGDRRALGDPARHQVVDPRRQRVGVQRHPRRRRDRAVVLERQPAQRPARPATRRRRAGRPGRAAARRWCGRCARARATRAGPGARPSAPRRRRARSSTSIGVRSANSAGSSPGAGGSPAARPSRPWRPVRRWRRRRRRTGRPRRPARRSGR